MAEIISCGITQAGTSKRLNEDSFLLDGRIYPDTLNAREQKIGHNEDYWQVYAVTDGMGGAGIGDISSRLVQSYLIELSDDFTLLDPYSFNFREYMQAFLNTTDQTLQERLKKHDGDALGCSLALIMFSGERCYTMSIGNCRIYLYRSGQLFRMSEDHVLADNLGERPLLFMGKRPGIPSLKAQNLKQMIVQPGDHFLICSDGITNSLMDEDIKWVLDKPSPLQSYAESLFQNARRFDARDNQTILALRVESRRIFDLPLAEQAQAEEKYDLSETGEYELINQTASQNPEEIFHTVKIPLLSAQEKKQGKALLNQRPSMLGRKDRELREEERGNSQDEKVKEEFAEEKYYSAKIAAQEALSGTRQINTQALGQMTGFYTAVSPQESFPMDEHEEYSEANENKENFLKVLRFLVNNPLIPILIIVLIALLYLLFTL